MGLAVEETVVSKICWRGEGSYLVYSVKLLDAFGRGFLSLLFSICRWARCDHGLEWKRSIAIRR